MARFNHIAEELRYNAIQISDWDTCERSLRKCWNIVFKWQSRYCTDLPQYGFHLGHTLPKAQLLRNGTCVLLDSGLIDNRCMKLLWHYPEISSPHYTQTLHSHTPYKPRCGFTEQFFGVPLLQLTVAYSSLQYIFPVIHTGPKGGSIASLDSSALRLGWYSIIAL